MAGRDDAWRSERNRRIVLVPVGWQVNLPGYWDGLAIENLLPIGASVAPLRQIVGLGAKLSKSAIRGHSVHARHQIVEPVRSGTRRSLIQEPVENLLRSERGKAMMRAAFDMSFEQSISYLETQIMTLALTEDAKEGRASFIEKRAPHWTGR